MQRAGKLLVPDGASSGAGVSRHAIGIECPTGGDEHHDE